MAGVDALDELTLLERKDVGTSIGISAFAVSLFGSQGPEIFLAYSGGLTGLRTQFVIYSVFFATRLSSLHCASK